MTLKQDYRICCFCPAVIRLHHSNRRPLLRLPPSSDVVAPQTTPGCRRQSSSFLHPLSSIHPHRPPFFFFFFFISLPPPHSGQRYFCFHRRGRVSLRDSAEQTQERVKFPDFPRKFPPINWFTSNVHPRGQRTPPSCSCFVVSSCKFVESVPRISRTKLLTHKLVQGKRKRDGFLKRRKCFERRF